MPKLPKNSKKEFIEGKREGTVMYKGKICPSHPEWEGLRYASNCSCYMCSALASSQEDKKKIIKAQEEEILQLKKRIQELEEELKNGR